jgi:hypothetical protein
LEEVGLVEAESCTHVETGVWGRALVLGGALKFDDLGCELSNLWDMSNHAGDFFGSMGAWRDRHLRACVSACRSHIWQPVCFGYERLDHCSQRQYNRSNL